MDTSSSSSWRRRLLRGFALSLALSVSFAGWEYWAPLYAAPQIEEGLVPPADRPSLRVLSLNAAHGRGVAFHQTLTRDAHIRSNLDTIAELIVASDADVVALQELDGPSFWSGGFDHLEYLARATGFDHAYHGFHVERSRPRLNYGTGVLSRVPIVEGHSRAFGRNVLDTKGFVRTHLETEDGIALDVVSVHLDFKRASERAAQLEILNAHLEEVREDAGRHLVVAGDFNATLSSRRESLRPFVERLRLDVGLDGSGTFPVHRPRRRIDHVFVSEGLNVLHEQVIDVAVSDHLPVLVEVRPHD